MGDRKMKKFFIRFYLGLSNWLPWHLRSEIRSMNETIRSKDLKLADARNEIDLLRIQVDSLHEVLAMRKMEESTARAMLFQLRVHQESVRRRTGYMVSAFIPDGAVTRLAELGEAKQKEFVTVVAEVLVNNALSGILKRHQSTNKLTALIFEPITKLGQNVQLVGGIFETDQRPEFVPMTDKAPSIKQLYDVK